MGLLYLVMDCGILYLLNDALLTEFSDDAFEVSTRDI